MKMSEKMAVRLHIMMWSDMRKEIGDTPDASARNRFKEKWCMTHFPEESINFNCFLCEYSRHEFGTHGCDKCPIKWPDDACSTTFGLPPAKVDYRFAPISEILALPARNEKLTGLEAEYIANDKETAAKWYYQYREELLSKASGIPASAAIEDHVKKIQEKASNEQESNGALEKLLSDTVNTLKLYQSALSYESKLPSNAPIADHIKVIVKNARDEGFDTAKEYLAECSGVDQNNLIFDHIRAIKEKAVQQSTFSQMYCDAKTELAKASGLPEADEITDHIKAIQEKAVEEYFAKTPGAKLATMDVDQAFKQYADEQKASIFKELAAESGLDSTATVKAHIDAIYSDGFDDGKGAERERIKMDLAKASGLPEAYTIADHLAEIRKSKQKASHEKDMELLRKTSMQLSEKLEKYKDALSKGSNLDRNRPVDDHIREIVKNSMEAGATEEQDRIMHRIGEMFNK